MLREDPRLNIFLPGPFSPIIIPSLTRKPGLSSSLNGYKMRVNLTMKKLIANSKVRI